MLSGKQRSFHSIRTSCILGALALMIAAPVLANSSALTGKVAMAGGKSLAAGSQVMIYHLSSEQTFTSTVIDASGRFEITGLPGGYYDVAIQTPDGLYVTNRVINLPPDGTAKISVKLEPLADGEQPRSFPGNPNPSNGIASVASKDGGFKGWIKTPTGAIVTGAAGVVSLFGVVGAASSSDNPTPPPACCSGPSPSCPCS